MSPSDFNNSPGFKRCINQNQKLNTNRRGFPNYSRPNPTPLPPLIGPDSSIWNTNRYPFNSGFVPTKVCDFWKRGQSCKFGSHCWFAHGPLPQCTMGENRLMNRENHTSPTQLTPEQQYWAVPSVPSDGVQNPIPYPNSFIPCHTKDILDSILTAALPVKLFGDTSNEFGQQRSVQTPIYPSTQPTERHVHNQQPSEASSSQSNNTLFSFGLDGIEGNSLPSGSTTVNNMNKATEDFFIPFEKEECPLYKVGQCPFGDDCFFEHN